MTNPIPDATPGGAEELRLNAEEVNRLWQLDGLALNTRQTALLPELKRWLERRHEVPLAQYLTGGGVLSLSQQAASELAPSLLARFRPASEGVEVLGLLAKVIDRGNTDGLFRICPPPIPHLLRRQPSPFNYRRWPNRETATKIRAYLAESMRANEKKRSRHPPAPERIARAVIGQVLVSAIVHGGLASKAALEALLRRLAEDGPASDVAGDRVYLELSLDYQKQPDAEFRRWFPDPLTAVLIIRLRPGTVTLASGERPVSRTRVGDLVWRCIKAFLPPEFRQAQSLRSLGALLDAVILDLESRIPVYLANYAGRKFISHSLRPNAFRRLMGLAPLAAAESPEGNSAGLGGQADGATDDEPTSLPEPRWLPPLRAAMRGKDRGGIVAHIDMLLEEHSAGSGPDRFGPIFIGFAKHLLVRNKANRGKFAVSTARAMVISVSIRVGGLTGCSPTRFDTGHWAALYEEAMEDADTPGMRRRLARALKEFQRYLEREHGIDPVDDPDILSAANGLVPVDANIISQREFIAIRERFGDGNAETLPGLLGDPDPDRVAIIGWLLLTLGYRCGLRRSEALMIKTRDLQTGKEPMLLIRPSELRDLKTKTSTRRIPLDRLLDEAELQKLYKFRQTRSEERSFGSEFFFSIPTTQNLFAPPELMFSLLPEVMRTVTGDSSLRFHHLRHSFASRTYLALAASQSDSMAELATLLPDDDESCRDPGRLRKAMFTRTGTTRRDLWAVASLLGHSGPEVSLEHYIHHLDIALAAALKVPGIAPSRPTLILAAGTSPSQASHEIGSKDLSAWAALLHRRKFKPGPGAATSPPPPEYTEAPTRSSAEESLDRIWRLLLASETLEREIKSFGKTYGFTKKKILSCVATAKWLSDLKLSPNGREYRHRFMEWIPDKRHPQVKQRIACPLKPHEERDKAVMKRLGEAFRSAIKIDRSTVKGAVALFAREARPDYGGLIFRDPRKPETAKSFLKFLCLLGCQPHEIEFTSYDKTQSNATTIATWRNALNLDDSTRVETRSPFNGRSNWPCQWLGIQPVFAEERGKMQGSAGFRFMMVMAAIAMGERDAK